MNISFRKITESNFKQIFNWLQQPHVTQWWPEIDWEKFLKKYRAKIDSDYVHAYIISIDEQPIGMIQYYWFSKVPQGDESHERFHDPYMVGLDIVIGEPSYIGKGYGSRALCVFTDQVLKQKPLIKKVFINPDSRNKAAIRAYEKAGFKIDKRSRYKSTEKSWKCSWNCKQKFKCNNLTIIQRRLHEKKYKNNHSYSGRNFYLHYSSNGLRKTILKLNV